MKPRGGVLTTVLRSREWAGKRLRERSSEEGKGAEEEERERRVDCGTAAPLPHAPLFTAAQLAERNTREEEQQQQAAVCVRECGCGCTWACLSPALVPLFLVDVGWTDDGSDEGACAEASISRCQWA